MAVLQAGVTRSPAAANESNRTAESPTSVEDAFRHKKLHRKVEDELGRASCELWRDRSCENDLFFARSSFQKAALDIISLDRRQAAVDGGRTGERLEAALRAPAPLASLGDRDEGVGEAPVH